MGVKGLLVGAAVAICLGLSACAHQQSAEPDAVAQEQALLAVDRAYLDYNAANGFNAATERFMDFGSGFLIESGRGFLHGREAILAERSLNTVPSPVHWEPQHAMVSRSDDLGLTWGVFEVDGGAKGSYMTIWRRDASGEWKFVTDVAVDDPPTQE